jgi:hypothetical protein
METQTSEQRENCFRQQYEPFKNQHNLMLPLAGVAAVLQQVLLLGLALAFASAMAVCRSKIDER